MSDYMTGRFASTPWGRADHARAVGTINGQTIYTVSTPSHGGYYVPSALLNRIPPDHQARAQQWSGSPQWYEEDCEWASVAVAFPEYFTPEQLTAARQTIQWREQP